MVTTKTKRIRGRVLQRINRVWLAAHPLCARCQEKDPPVVTMGTQVDHIVPLFKGGAESGANRQTLCDPCHAEKTREDLGQQQPGADETGWPLDPSHPWNVRR